MKKSNFNGFDSPNIEDPAESEKLDNIDDLTMIITNPSNENP